METPNLGVAMVRRAWIAVVTLLHFVLAGVSIAIGWITMVDCAEVQIITGLEHLDALPGQWNANRIKTVFRIRVLTDYRGT